jgi:hypothetical protein
MVLESSLTAPPPHKTRGKLLGGWFHVNFGSLQMRLRDVSCKGVCGVTYRLTSNWGYQLLYHQAQDTSTDQNVMLLQSTHSATYMIVVLHVLGSGVNFFSPNFVMLLKWWQSISIFSQIWQYFQNMKVNRLKHLSYCRKLWLFRRFFTLKISLRANFFKKLEYL